MENQKHSQNIGRPLPGNEESSYKETKDENKEPSILDKLKEQIKKMKQLKEKGPGSSDHTEQ